MGDATNPANLPPVDEFEGLVCFCHGVPRAEIRAAIQNGAVTLEAIKACTKASTGCGGCTSEVEALLAEELAKKKKPA